MADYFIPKEIIAGFQKRNTETGKLSFLTYNDEKGKMKFEASWKGWINNKIPSETFNNDVMTELRVGSTAGGCKSGWNYRQEYIQISDVKRGLTFEIPTSDFIWLLDFCVCDHGILKGEFIFAWLSNNLNLLPTNSNIYKEAKKFSDNYNSNKISKVSQMIPGRKYKVKNPTYSINNEVYFIGNLPTITNDLNKYKSRLVFLHNSDTFFFSDIKNVEFEIGGEKPLTKDELKEYVNRFEHSPYSNKWWKEYRFNSTLKSICKYDTGKYGYNFDRIYSTSIDIDGNVYTHRVENHDAYEYNKYYGGSSKSLNIKLDKEYNKSIKWFNILNDKNIQIPIMFNSNYYCAIKEDPRLEFWENTYICFSKDYDKTLDNWKSNIKDFIEKNTINKQIDIMKIESICDNYSFRLSDFLMSGFIFGVIGNFSVNTKYRLANKVNG